MFREPVRLEVECQPRPGTERGGFGSVSSRQTSTPPTALPRPIDRIRIRPTDRPTDSLDLYNGKWAPKEEELGRVPCCR